MAGDLLFCYNILMDKLRDATLIFLIKKAGNEITDVCLALKKRSFGKGRWNGSGGKVDSLNETVEQAALRETKEEIGVQIEEKDLNKVAENAFYFPHNADWNQLVHVYLVENWVGEPKESEEMNPKWFKVNNIPYSEMWPCDIFWLPKVLKGNLIKSIIKFGEHDIILSKEINIVSKM